MVRQRVRFAVELGRQDHEGNGDTGGVHTGDTGGARTGDIEQQLDGRPGWLRRFVGEFPRKQKANDVYSAGRLAS